MTRTLSLVFLVSISLLIIGPTRVLASSQGADKPSIRILNLHDGETIYGSTVTVDVAVSHFKLVKPILLPAGKWKTIPLLPGNQGHIHYILDSMANMVLTRDVVVRKSHTWTHVSPGPHTVITYLATSQHAQFPGTKASVAHITVAAARPSGPTPSIRIASVQTARQGTGVALRVHVAVSHFKLVPPIYKNPPLLPGNQGHIHYVLDSLSNFQAGRDAVTALSHPWTHVSPGWHTVIAYLATSQHQQFPGTKPATVRVDVPPGKVAVRVQTLPVTGGSPDSHDALLGSLVLGLLVTLLGLGLIAYPVVQRSSKRAPCA